MSTNEASDKAVEKAKETKSGLLKRLEDDGVVNPAGFSMLAFGGLFLAAVPVTSFIARPNGLLEKAVNGLCHSIAYIGTAGASSTVGQTGKIAALSTLYVAFTYALTGAASAAGAASGLSEGRDNNHPRKQTAKLTGLPLRLHSAHYNLMEMFPGFALTAALAQATAPTDQTLVNLLGLHVLSKVFVYYPSYIADVAPSRTLAHLIATSSVINVALRLATNALV